MNKNERLYIGSNIDELFDKLSDKFTSYVADFKNPRSTKNKGEFGTVYLVHNPHNGLYKIGITTNLNSRLSGMRCGSGSHISIVAFVDLLIGVDVKPFLVEDVMHSFFSNKKIVGEWFRLNASDLFVIKMFFNEVLYGDLIGDYVDRHLVYLSVVKEFEWNRIEDVKTDSYNILAIDRRTYELIENWLPDEGNLFDVDWIDVSNLDKLEDHILSVS